MKTKYISEIVVNSNRQRKDFDIDELTKLRDSIASKGLLHPIVLENDHKTLVAGERRIRAIKLLRAVAPSYRFDNQSINVNEVPYVVIGDLSPIDIREAELEENIIRVELSWQERAQAIKELSELRWEQNAGRVTYKELAKEIAGKGATSSDQMFVSDAISLASHLDDPDIASAPTQREAMRRLQKKAKKAINTALAIASGNKVSSGDHILILGDAKEELAKLDDRVFDCVITDPPYGINASAFGTQAATEHDYEDDYESAMETVAHILTQSFRISKGEAHLYLFCSIEMWQHLRNMAGAVGWDVWPRPLIWAKGHLGMLPRPNHGPRYTYEAILFANKGDKETQIVGSDVLNFIPDDDKENGAQKPVELYAELLRRSCQPGDRIIDMCCGTGTVFAAANKLKLIATGIEREKDQYAIASMRIVE